MNFGYRNWIKLVCMGAFILSSQLLQADWDPEYCFLDEDISPLNEPKFKQLKNSVIRYLKDSWCSAEKAKLLMDVVLMTKPQVCVEIGACTGASVLPVAATLKYLGKGKVYAIDAWSNEDAVRNLEDSDPNKLWWSTVNMGEIYKIFQQTLNVWTLHSFCTAIRSTSSLAVNRVGEIDFLHIDGDYSETGSLQDVQNYLPKVKKGGYILFSNFFIMINGKQPKLKALVALSESCEMVSQIENDNAILFKKSE